MDDMTGLAAQGATGRHGDERVRRGAARALLWTAVTRRRRDLALTCLLYSFAEALGMLIPVIVGSAIGDSVAHGDLARTPLWIGLLVLVSALSAIGSSLGQLTSRSCGQHGSHWLRMRVVDAVVRPRSASDHDPGHVLTLAASDADRVGSFGGLIANNVASGVSITVGAGLLFSLSPLLGSAILLGAAALVVVQRLLGRRVTDLSAREQAARATTTALADDILRGLRVLVGIGAGRSAASAFRAVSDASARASIAAAGGEARLRAAGVLISGLYATTIIAVGSALALTDQLRLSAFLSSVALLAYVVYPLLNFAAFGSWWSSAIASSERLIDLIAAADVLLPHSADAGNRAPGRRRAQSDLLVLERVQLRRGGVVDLRIEPGRMIGIVTPESSTAQHLVSLLGLQEVPEVGRILLDGDDVQSVAIATVRDRVLVSLHTAELLPGTIDDNLRLRARDDGAVEASVVAAAVDQVLESVAGGAAAAVGDRGERLSGGQRQRVALARALAADPPVLVLHDPTTAIDSVTEQGIAERVARLRSGRTTVVVTTSAAWLRHCDDIALVARGEVVRGTHPGLMSDPLYARMVAR